MIAEQEPGELLAILIEVRGEVVSSNFTAFAEMVRARLGEINRDLKTDEDFDRADSDAKAITSAESALKSAKEKALSDAEQLHALFSQIDGLSGDLAAARLDLTKQITKRKDEVKTEIVEESLATLDIDPGLARRTYLASLQNAIKGKRTVESMRKSVETTVLVHQATIKRSRAIVEAFAKANGPDLVMDARELEVRPPDSVEAELRRRLDMKKAEEEKTALAAEVAKAKTEAAQATAALAESAKPPAPPLTPDPAEDSPWGESKPKPQSAPKPAAEWDAFKAACRAAFAPIRPAREALRDPTNIARAEVFAATLNGAWQEVVK